MSDSKPLRVLVVGDWVVDENWTVAPGNPTAPAERLGIYHRSSVRRPHGVHCLSGAGRVARTVRERLMKEGTPVEVVGLGLWAEHDGNVMRALFADSDILGNHYQLTHPEDGQAHRVDGVKLINLATFLGQPKEDKFSTTRGFQIFKSQPSGEVELSVRVDWESPVAPYCGDEGAQVWRLRDDQRLEQELKREVEKLDAIIVKCLGKGVVSTKLVELLAKTYPGVPWYVSTKLGRRAHWLPVLGGKVLRLLLFSESAIQKDFVTEWRLGDRSASHEAVNFLNEVARSFEALDTPGSAIVVMSKPLSLVTRHVDEGSSDGDLYLGVSRYNKGLDALPSRMGKASVLFGYLAAELLRTKPDSVRFKTILEKGLKDAYEWGRTEKRRLGGKLDEGIQQSGEGGAKRASGPSNSGEKDPPSSYDIDCERWDDNARDWDQSRSGLGIIERDGELFFDLWRGRSCVKEYIAISERRRNTAATLFRMIREFRDRQPEPTRSVSCLLMDAPGRGKSSLVKGVAKNLGVEFREIDMSQLNEPADLANRLDGIVTDQTEVRRRFLIFVDEVDSDEGRWYARFLAPLESGYYVRGGSRFYVKPCAWVFAGSTPRSPEGVKDSPRPEQSTKLPDFRSRLTDGEMHLSEFHGRENSREWKRRERLERVYIGVSMLRATFPYVKWITPGVLFALYRLKLSIGVREMRHLIENIDGVLDDKICSWQVYRAGDEFASGVPLFLNFQRDANINGTMDDRPVMLRDLS